MRTLEEPNFESYNQGVSRRRTDTRGTSISIEHSHRVKVPDDRKIYAVAVYDTYEDDKIIGCSFAALSGHAAAASFRALQ